MLFSILFMCQLGLGLGQMEPMCSSSATTPGCTLTFTPWMAAQCKPTSTVYQAIMTTIYDVVDCRYCTVTNVAANPPAIGPFTTRITRPVLVVTRVGCMRETAAITRRELRGFEEAASSTDVPSPRAVTIAKFVAPAPQPAIPARRHAPLHYRQSENPLLNTTLPQPFNKTVPRLTGEAAVLVRQLVTAEYSIALVNTPGMNLFTLCAQLRLASSVPGGAGLETINVDANQAADIICFVAYYGLDLHTTTSELLSNISAAIIAVDLRAVFNDTTDPSLLCNSIDYSNLPELGVDTDSASSYICNNTFPSLTSASSPSTVATGTVATTSLASETGTTGTGATGTAVSGTGPTPPYANSTATATATGTAAGGTGLTGTAASRTVPSPPFVNLTSTSTETAVGTGVATTDLGASGTAASESGAISPSANSTAASTNTEESGAYTTSDITTSETGISGTAFGTTGTSRPAATGTGEVGTTAGETGYGYGPYDNGTSYPTGTGSDSLSIDFANATYGMGRAPPIPTSHPYYPAWTTRTSTAQYRGY